MAGHEVLCKDLAALEPCGGCGWANNRQSSGSKIVHDASYQRRLRADYDQIDLPTGGSADHTIDVVGCELE